MAPPFYLENDMTEDTKRGPGRPPKAETVSVRVLRGFWPTENQEDRVRKGQIIEVTKDDLIAGLEAGTMERIK